MSCRLNWEPMPDHYRLSRRGDLEAALGNLILPKPRGFVVRGSKPEDADTALSIIEDYFDANGVEWAAVVEDGYALGDVIHGWHTDGRPAVGSTTRHSFHRTYEGQVRARLVDSKPALWDKVTGNDLPRGIQQQLVRGEVNPDYFDTSGREVMLSAGDLCVFPLDGPFPPAHDFTNVAEPRTSNTVDVVIPMDALRRALS